MIDFELVVARSHEPLSWLRRVPDAWRITIYNKGAPIAHPSIPLPNLGREAHTYLHHLVSRRHSLARQTVFVQGHPFDHAPDLHDKLAAWSSRQIVPAAFEWLGFFIDWDDPDGHRLFVPWSKNPQHLPLPTGRLYQRLLQRPPPPRFLFFGGAQFSLSSDLALRRPASFFLRALQLASSHPLAPHAFERFWDHVFNVNGIPPPLQNGPFPLYLKKIRRLETAPSTATSPDPDLPPTLHPASSAPAQFPRGCS